MPDGRAFIESDYSTAWLRDRQTGQRLWTVDRWDRSRLLPSPDSARIASAGSIAAGRGGLRMHDARDGRVLWNHPGIVEPLAFSADGREVYAFEREWFLLILDTATGKLRLRIDLDRHAATGVLPVPVGGLALVTSYQHVAAYDLGSGKPIWRSEDPTDPTYAPSSQPTRAAPPSGQQQMR
jgi:hypothetical protein